MKARLPLIRISLYIIISLIIFGSIGITILPGIKSRKEDIKNIEEAFKQKEEVLNVLSNKQGRFLEQLDNLDRALEIDNTSKVLVNKLDLRKYLEFQSLSKGVELKSLDVIDFSKGKDLWEVKYSIGLQGLYKDVIDFIDVLSEVGDNFFSKEVSLLQAGILDSKDNKITWIDSDEYLLYKTKGNKDVKNHNYATGLFKVPLLIDTAEGPRIFLRLQDIVYSDPTITRYDWQLKEALLMIGEEEYGLGYPKADFKEKELALNMDFELKEAMIGSSIKGVKLYWHSLNKEHEVVLALNKPIKITPEMFAEDPWVGQINEEIEKYNLDMLNSVVYTNFNIVFSMKEVPDVYFDFIIEEIEKLKAGIQDYKIELIDKNTIEIIKEEKTVYSIDDETLLLNGEKLFDLNSGKFIIEGDSLTVRLDVLGNIKYNLLFEGVAMVEAND